MKKRIISFSIAACLIASPVQSSANQFADPAFNNLRYEYFVQSQRFLLETKILTAFKEQHHPFLTAGFGGHKLASGSLQKTIIKDLNLASLQTALPVIMYGA